MEIVGCDVARVAVNVVDEEEGCRVRSVGDDHAFVWDVVDGLGEELANEWVVVCAVWGNCVCGAEGVSPEGVVLVEGFLDEEFDCVKGESDCAVDEVYESYYYVEAVAGAFEGFAVAAVCFACAGEYGRDGEVVVFDGVEFFD